MYTNFRDVVQATLDKYQNASSLAIQYGICLYNHNTNGIGCAIGCHLSSEQAAWLDENRVRGVSSLYEDNVWKQDEDIEAKAREIIESVFDLKTIHYSQLGELQSVHDASSSVDNFRQRLATYLAHDSWRAK